MYTELEDLKKNKIIWIIIVSILFICTIIVSAVNVKGGLTNKKLDGLVQASDIYDNCIFTTNKDGENVETCYPIYTYQASGNTYTCKSSVVTGKISNETHYVHYDTKNPSQCMNDTDIQINFLGVLVVLILVILVIFSLFVLFSIIKKMKTMKRLQNKGTLIKDLPYSVTDAKFKMGNDVLKAPAVTYTTPDGKELYLIGNLKYDKKFSESDKIDLLIDLDDTKNYIIDFNLDKKIKR